MTTPFTVEDARLIQRVMKFPEHVAYVDLARGFVLAHTDEERRAADAGGPVLSECEVHKFLVEHGDCVPGLCCCFEASPGWYRIAAPHEVKGIPW
jgi:hypothetical protein